MDVLNQQASIILSANELITSIFLSNSAGSSKYAVRISWWTHSINQVGIIQSAYQWIISIFRSIFDRSSECAARINWWTRSIIQVGILQSAYQWITSIFWSISARSSECAARMSWWTPILLLSTTRIRSIRCRDSCSCHARFSSVANWDPYHFRLRNDKKKPIWIPYISSIFWPKSVVTEQWFFVNFGIFWHELFWLEENFSEIISKKHL